MKVVLYITTYDSHLPTQPTQPIRIFVQLLRKDFRPKEHFSYDMKLSAQVNVCLRFIPVECM